jgi:hypothetical protein
MTNGSCTVGDSSITANPLQGCCPTIFDQQDTSGAGAHVCCPRGRLTPHSHTLPLQTYRRIRHTMSLDSADNSILRADSLGPLELDNTGQGQRVLLLRAKSARHEQYDMFDRHRDLWICRSESKLSSRRRS